MSNNYYSQYIHNQLEEKTIRFLHESPDLHFYESDCEECGEELAKTKNRSPLSKELREKFTKLLEDFEKTRHKEYTEKFVKEPQINYVEEKKEDQSAHEKLSLDKTIPNLNEISSISPIPQSDNESVVVETDQNSTFIKDKEKTVEKAKSIRRNLSFTKCKISARKTSSHLTLPPIDPNQSIRLPTRKVSTGTVIIRKNPKIREKIRQKMEENKENTNKRMSSRMIRPPSINSKKFNLPPKPVNTTFSK
ncbi:hypothetical protein SNEBB_001803 [Seison nebaliae]|nr:hypothetical protein SNEBB_001803 [Seison nebaliae]